MTACLRLRRIMPRAGTTAARALQALNKHADAAASFGKAIELQKDYADAHSNQALALLTAGDLRRGFEQYEWRWQRTGMEGARRKTGRPLWLGEYPLGHKTILLHAEQGLGDTIQFARYVPMLARGGATVILEVQPELKSLLAGIDGVASCHARGETLPAFEVHCPLGSLPLAFKTDSDSVPANIPYLKSGRYPPAPNGDPQIDAISRPRVALAWAGRASHANDRNRSIRLAQLAPLLSLEMVQFICIQRELRDDDAVLLARTPRVRSIGSELADMADTAAVFALADLVIAVDTSVVHLAGAMGRPVWVMLPFTPDWRWTLQGERSPWYPNARLFRQPAPGDWTSVIANVRTELATFAPNLA